MEMEGCITLTGTYVLVENAIYVFLKSRGGFKEKERERERDTQISPIVHCTTVPTVCPLLIIVHGSLRRDGHQMPSISAHSYKTTSKDPNGSSDIC